MIVYLEVDLQDGSPLTYQERVAHALEEHARWLRLTEAEQHLGQTEPDVYGTILRWDTNLDVGDQLLCHDHDYLVVSEEDAASLRDLLRSLEDALISTEGPTPIIQAGAQLLEDLRDKREPWLPSVT